MTDIALRFDQARWSADLAIEGGGLATDDGLVTAIMISLFTDARAREDDPLPYPGADRRGWWGDTANVNDNDAIGSRLWLLEREKLTEATRNRARDYVREALAWLTEDGIARDVTIDVGILPISTAHPLGALTIGISLTRPDGPARQRYDFTWTATARSIAA